MSLFELLKKDKLNELREMSDEEILSISISNPNAYKILIDRYKDAFVRKARSYLKRDEDVSDVVQEAFVKIYKAAPSFKEIEGARFSSWAYKILINTSLTMYQKRKKESLQTVFISDELEAILYDKEISDSHENKLDIDYLKYLIKDLPELLKRTVTLYSLEGLSYAEVAEIENVTEGVVRTRLHRARKILIDKHNKQYE